MGFMLVRSKRISQSAFLIPVIALAFVVFISPNLRTSGRKGFYLDAMSLVPGMSRSAVKERMKTYEIYEKHEGVLTFSYRSDVSTIDAVQVSMSNNGRYVSGVEYSPD